MSEQTRAGLQRLRRAYDDAQAQIQLRWAAIRSYEQGGGALVVIILLMLLFKVAFNTENPTFDIALIVAAFAVVVGAAGALIQSLVTHVISLEGAVEDLARQIALADDASSDATASEALAEAQRILDGRLRWALANPGDSWAIGQPPSAGRRWHWSRVGFAFAVEVAGSALVGFVVTVAIVGVRAGMVLQVLDVGAGPIAAGIVLIGMGHWLLVTDRRIQAAHAAAVERAAIRPT